MSLSECAYCALGHKVEEPFLDDVNECLTCHKKICEKHDFEFLDDSFVFCHFCVKCVIDVDENQAKRSQDLIKMKEWANKQLDELRKLEVKV